MIDSTIVRAHQHSAGEKKDKSAQGIGRSRGGPGSKIHARCDARGRPIGFHLTGSQAHDLAGVAALLANVQVKLLLATRSYDGEEGVDSRLRAKGCQGVIPSQGRGKVQGPYKKYLYRARHAIENFFVCLKQYRGLLPRYDKLGVNFLGAIHLAGIVIWLN